jgi:DNA-binding transcriptional LysR family regulator
LTVDHLVDRPDPRRHGLAEELHFGRTAERMFTSRSRVSQVIRAMETRAGGRLFERTSRQVRLTPLGEQLRDRLRPGYDRAGTRRWTGEQRGKARRHVTQARPEPLQPATVNHSSQRSARLIDSRH